MGADRVLIAYASRQGSTAWVGEAICRELRAAGLTVDCHPAAAVTDLGPYGAVVLGSGVFLARRGSDGGGFITRHREALSERPVWLFSAGPIGGTGSGAGDDAGCEEAPVVCVARDIGARGAATFGAAPIMDGPDDRRPSGQDWRELARVREWSRMIADELARPGRAVPAKASRRSAAARMFHRAAPTS